MLVGFMKNFKEPDYMAKLLAMTCKFQGIDLIYFRQKDINMLNKTVRGKMFINNTWTTVETKLPPFIDIAAYCFKKENREIIKYLRKNTFLSDDRTNRLSKKALQEKLLEDERFSSLVIPTIKEQGLGSIDDFLTKHSVIVMKPIGGEAGKGVYILKKERNHYVLGYKIREKFLTSSEFEQFYMENIRYEKYILQKHISSRTIHGDPFDCRVHVEKNGKGEWANARTFIRIGVGQKVISNVNFGGGRSDLNPFLKTNFKDNWKQIEQRLHELATTLPYKIEQLRATHIMTLGFDVGIEQNGQLYLFEANSNTGTDSLKAEVAMLRAEYYKYVLMHGANQELLKLKNIQKINDQLMDNIKNEQYEKNMYRQKYKLIKNSRTWKATAPVRKASKLTKQLLKKENLKM